MVYMSCLVYQLDRSYLRNRKPMCTKIKVKCVKIFSTGLGFLSSQIYSHIYKAGRAGFAITSTN